MSPRDESGIIWCSLILAQAIPFSLFMDKFKYSLDNQAFCILPKVSDNETVTDIGWLLYSTRQQDEDQLAALLTTLTDENIGVKWKPIQTTNGPNQRKIPADIYNWEGMDMLTEPLNEITSAQPSEVANNPQMQPARDSTIVAGRC